MCLPKNARATSTYTLQGENPTQGGQSIHNVALSLSFPILHDPVSLNLSPPLRHLL